MSLQVIRPPADNGNLQIENGKGAPFTGLVYLFSLVIHSGASQRYRASFRISISNHSTKEPMKTLITYSTLTGNTETAAQWIRDRLTKAGHSVQMEEAGNVYPDILKDYDLIVLGSPTYWDGEVTDDFVPFLDRLLDLDLRDKKAAVFGLGDSISYPDVFAKSVDVLEENLSKCGAQLVLASLKVDGEPERNKEAIFQWAENLGKIGN